MRLSTEATPSPILADFAFENKKARSHRSVDRSSPEQSTSASAPSPLGALIWASNDGAPAAARWASKQAKAAGNEKELRRLEWIKEYNRVLAASKSLGVSETNAEAA